MAPPEQIDWHALSPQARQVVAQIGFRLTAGYSLDEIAEILDRERPELRHLPLPARVTKSWVAVRVRELRQEMRAATTS